MHGNVFFFGKNRPLAGNQPGARFFSPGTSGPGSSVPYRSDSLPDTGEMVSTGWDDEVDLTASVDAGVVTASDSASAGESHHHHGFDQSGSDESESSGSDESGTDESEADESGADDADESEADESEADESEADESGADESEPDQSGADQSGADQSGADQPGADQSGADEPPGDGSGSGSADGSDLAAETDATATGNALLIAAGTGDPDPAPPRTDDLPDWADVMSLIRQQQAERMASFEDQRLEYRHAAAEQLKQMRSAFNDLLRGVEP